MLRNIGKKIAISFSAFTLAIAGFVALPASPASATVFGSSYYYGPDTPYDLTAPRARITVDSIGSDTFDVTYFEVRGRRDTIKTEGVRARLQSVYCHKYKVGSNAEKETHYLIWGGGSSTQKMEVPGQETFFFDWDYPVANLKYTGSGNCTVLRGVASLTYYGQNAGSGKNYTWSVYVRVG